jgi:hypothetical protein
MLTQSQSSCIYGPVRKFIAIFDKFFVLLFYYSTLGTLKSNPRTLAQSMPSLARRAVLVMALAGGTPLVHGFVTAPGLARWGSAAPKPSWGAVRGQVPILRTRGTTTHAAVAAPVRTGGSGDDGEGGVNEGSDARDDAVQRSWPAKELRVKDYSLSRGEVAVRFINAPGRYPSDGTNDIIAAAQPGENLLKVGDSVGGKRALRVPLVLGNAWCSPPTLADTATRTPVRLPRPQ